MSGSEPSGPAAQADLASVLALLDEAQALARRGQVDAAGLGRVRAEAAVPGAERVALDVAEGMAVKADNELVHVGMIEVAADQLVLLIRLPPPAHNFRRL